VDSAIRPKRRVFALYMIPGILIYTLTVFLPIGYALFYGFFNWKGGKKMTFIALENFADLMRDAAFWRAFNNNLYIIVLCLVGQIGIALIFSLLLNSRMIRFKSLHRAMSYFPVTLSAVVIGFIWSMIYDYNYGLLNALLRQLGMASSAQPWLNNMQWVMTFVCLPLIWQYIGFYLVIILSSLATLDQQVFEMAEIDGANGWQRAMHITMPMLKKTLLVCVTLCIAGNMKAFDHIYVLTMGGPGTTTNVVAMYAYNTSFLRYKMGYGSAMSIAILLLSLALVGGSQWLLGRMTRGKEA